MEDARQEARWDSGRKEGEGVGGKDGDMRGAEY